MSERRVSAYDASFIDDADDDAPLNVGGFITLERDPAGLSLERLRTLLSERLAALPRLRQRIVPGPAGRTWVDDERFDIARHVDQLPFRRDDPDLSVRLADLHARPLDGDRPPWRIDLAPAGDDGGPARFFRASHSLVDGLSSMLVMRALFDGRPGAGGDRRRSAGIGAGGDDRGPDGAGGQADDPDAGTVLRDVWRSMRPGSATLRPEQYDNALTLLDGWLSMLDKGQHGMPRFSGDGPVLTRVGLTELPSPALRRRRLDEHVRFDELGLTVVGGALGRLFAARGSLEPDARIRTLVPIGGLSRDAGVLGNRSSYLLIALPVAPMSATARLGIVRDEVQGALRAGQHRAATMSLRALDTLPGESADAISAFTSDRRFVDLVVSCIPGPRRRLRLDGVNHDVTFALLPITRHVRIAVGMLDVAGRLGVSITADATSLPELDFVLDGMRRTAAELAAGS
jgi:WS/DGAT/MGAT family acyltransferase